MTHPTDRAEAMREACAKACENHGVTSDQVADLWWDGYRDGREDAARAIRALPLPAAPAHDAVREARERVVEAAKVWERDPRRGLATHLSMADLVDAVDALLAAESAQRGTGASGDQRDEKGGDRG